MSNRFALHGLCALLVLLFLPGPVWAEEELPRIVLMGIRTTTEIDESVPNFNQKLRQALRYRLKRIYVVVPSDEAQEALVACNLTSNEILGKETDAGELAKALLASRILVGHASEFEGEVTLKARVFNAETGAYGEWGTIFFDDITFLWDRTRPLLEDVGLLPPELEEGPEYFKAQTGSERVRIIRRQFRNAGEDAQKLMRLHEWLTDRGLVEEAERCVERVGDLEPDSAWVAERQGRVDLRKVYARIPEDDLLFDHPNRACEELERMQEYAPDWGSRQEQRKAERLIKEVRRHLERLKTDERYLDEFRVVQRVEKSPLLGNLHFQVRSRPPYLVFAEHEEYASPQRVAVATAAADRLLDELHGTYQAFRRAFEKELKLPDLDAIEVIDDRIFKVFLFKDQKSFAAFSQDIDTPSPLRRLGPYYLTSGQWLLTYPAPNDAAAEPILTRTRAAGARQIFHLMKKLVLGGDTPESVLWSDPGLTGSVAWFELGLPAMLGAGIDVDRSPQPAFRVNRSLLEEWRTGGGGKDFDVVTLTGIDDTVGVQAEWGLRGGKGRGLPIFQAQSWALCDYLWHADSGRHRKGLLKYMKGELHGKSGAKAFRQAIFGRRKPHWTRLEERWRKWVEGL